jgi:hypothetical protein
MAGKEAKQVFNISRDWLGQGDVVFAWQPRYNYIAIVGDSRVVFIVDRQGNKVTEM